ncbi:MAG TPA: aminotransferase class V-fold PLP-dependent enzyme [Candidatus Acidoferrum sp.]|nr:aminotransferase class V-fold PLP-dependent enzyme [Candidatus Acidoferrum sp.]
MSTNVLQFKIATEEWEFEQIHELNYRTFVEEIPQHQPAEQPRLVDKFHEENTYLICLAGRRVVGMLAARGQRPFSLDQKLPDLDSYLPSGRRPCEVRLLAVEKEYRNSQVFRGIISLMWQFGTERGYNMAIISGTTRQQKLYRHLGFVPFGPLVGKGEAMFQPMYLTLEGFEKKAEEFFSMPVNLPGPASFLPGPVSIHREVRKAFGGQAESHRSDRFVTEFQRIRERLCELTGARHVQILLGSGSLANDTVAAQLSLQEKPGLVLSNGEFGERLVDHARRFGLTFDTLQFPWGEPIDMGAVQQFMTRSPALGWLWFAHGETSTGMLNPLSPLQALCGKRKIKLCADCISSVGMGPVNLAGVYLASAASGKGLASYPGLSMVFYNHAISHCARLPRYLDLGWYAEHQGIPFTHSSNLVRALDTALRREDWPRKHAQLAEDSAWLRGRLRGLGLNLVTPDAEAMAGVITIVPEPGRSGLELAQQLEQAGFLLSCNSEYLKQRNWIQICLMGEYSREKLDGLVACLARHATAGAKAETGRGAAAQPRVTA